MFTLFLGRQSADEWKSWTLARRSSAQTSTRLHYLELRYSAHAAASTESHLRRQYHPVADRYDDGASEEADVVSNMS